MLIKTFSTFLHFDLGKLHEYDQSSATGGSAHFPRSRVSDWPVILQNFFWLRRYSSWNVVSQMIAIVMCFS